MISIEQASNPVELDAVRGLMREFVDWHHERHATDLHLVKRYFDPQGFETELAGLPGKFAPPRGRLLLAMDGGKAAGCVALHDLGENVCEMKRLFVSPAFHGRGLGKALAMAVISEAKDLGYRRMRLDTGARQYEAQELYRRLGFRLINPYYDLDEEMANWLVFMERDLEVHGGI